MNHPRRFVPSTLLALALLAAGCAGSRMPPPDMSAARSAIADADQAGAGEAAPLALRNARQKLERAERAMEDDDYQTAQFLTHEAEVDAELAEATSRSMTAQAAVDELRESIRVLRDEINRNRQGGGR